jgi:hypothetical protein
MIPTIPVGFISRRRLHAASARDQIDDKDDYRDDEQQMDEPAAKMTDEAEKPENQNNNEDSPEHKISFGLSFFCFVRRPTVALKDFSISQTFGDATAFYINSNKVLAAKIQK